MDDFSRDDEFLRETTKLVRAPALPVVICVAIGILADRIWETPWPFWLAGGLVCAAGWTACNFRHRNRMAVGWLLAACVAFGGARHHLVWSVRQSDDISRYATDRPQPVKLTGRLAHEPVIVAKTDDPLRSAWPMYDRSLCAVECSAIYSAGQRVPVSGRVQLAVTGHVLHAHVGDEVQVSGHLSQTRPPANPGEYDYREHMRRRGILATVNASFPDAVRVADQGNGWRRWRNELREECEFLFVRYLDRRTQPLASALLLGNRTQLPDGVRSAFVDSGTMHLLSISGLHVGILAGFLFVCCRFLKTSNGTTAAVVLIGVIGYALLTDSRPPVVRATIMISVLAAGLPGWRNISAVQTLALSALAVLIWNPTDLFDSGAQLSFLAVGAIAWSASRLPRWIREPGVNPRFPAAMAVTAERHFGYRVLAWLLGVYLVTGAVWVAATPLMAWKFHFLSPIGIAMNVLLIPAMIVVMWCGYVLLFCGLLIPWFAGLFGFAFHYGLTALLFVVDSAADIPGGHAGVPQISGVWVIGFYCLLAAAICSPYCFRGFRQWRERNLTDGNRAEIGDRSRQQTAQRVRWVWCAVWGWVVVGLIWGLAKPMPDRLRCTFLSLGHGSAVLVEMPNGQTLLYDAGKINDGRRAQRVVQSALWSRGRSRIEALVLSHADLDHFNAVPGLLQTIPVGTVCLSRSFFRNGQPEVEAVSRAILSHSIPVRFVQQDDVLAMDESVRLRILHPAGASFSEEDNVNSIVLSLEFAGRRILLAGDLEEDGLSQLLSNPRQKVDVLLSPHHGSLKANPEELAEWARPDWVVVSGGPKRPLGKLREVYGSGSRVLRTGESGAITFEIDRSGEIRCVTARRDVAR